MNPISGFLKTVLEWIYMLVGNYGWSVILFTVLVRAVLLPLDIKSKRGMRAMSAVQPKMQALQKKYANDKEKLNQKMNELYKKEKINPMAGCLPMLIQMPILFCMFTAMRVVANEETVRMLVDWASHFTEGGYDALAAWIAGGGAGAEGAASIILSWEEIVARGLNTAFQPDFQSFMWIKNIYQPDSFGTSIMPTLNSLSTVAQVGGTYLTTDHIEIAKAFLTSDAYAHLLSSMGADNFTTITIPFLITNFNLTFPASWEALSTAANGLFILPILAGLSQFVSTLIMPQQQQTDASGKQQGGMGNFMKWFFPIFSVFICATSTAAFSLYWVAVNLIMIVQQQVINWYFDQVDKKKKEGEEALNP